jgi:hypothetical protein
MLVVNHGGLTVIEGRQGIIADHLANRHGAADVVVLYGFEKYNTTSTKREASAFGGQLAWPGDTDEQFGGDAGGV